LYWLQRNCVSFHLSTGAVNQAWDVASSQIRSCKLLLPHELIQQKDAKCIASHSGATLTANVGPDSEALQAHPCLAITRAFKAPDI